MKRVLLCAAVFFSGCINFTEEYWKYHSDGGAEVGGGTTTGGGSATGGGSTTGGGAGTGGGSQTGGGTATGGGSATGGGDATGGGASATGGGDGSGGGTATGGGTTTGGGSATGGGASTGGGANTGGGGEPFDAGPDVFLTSLTVTPSGALTFNEATLAYFVHVPNDTTAITLNFTAPQTDIINVNGMLSTTSANITLTSSVTTVTIVVQAASGTTRTYVLTIVPTLAQDAYVKASIVTQRFGQSVALSGDGNTMVVGAYAETGGGAAYVFRNDGGVWFQQARLVASNRDNNDFFGTAVAVNANGTTIAVGANGEASSSYGANATNPTSNTAAFAGAVYVYTFTTSWAQESYIKASNTDANDQFGVSLSLSDDGDSLAVGAPNESSNENTVLQANQLNGGDNNASQSGAAYIYRRSGSWAADTYFKAPNCGAGDNFGRSVALSGDGRTLAVGAIQEDGEDGGFISIGAVYVFKTPDGEDWTATPAILRGAAANQYFGTSVAIDGDGDTLAVGARGESSVASFSGGAFMFSFDGGSWSPPLVLKAPTPRANDEMGISIALSRNGLVCIVGSEAESNTGFGVDSQTGSWASDSSGAAYVFARQGNTWARDAYLKASNADGGDQFGHSVTISGDGRTLAAGADAEASSATTVNGNQSNNSADYRGAAYIFSR